MLCMSKVLKETQNTFLLITLLISNWFSIRKNVLESWDSGLSNHTIKWYICQSMSKVSKVQITFDTFNIHGIWWYGWKDLSLSILKLQPYWKLVKYWESYEQRCVWPFWTSFNTFDIHSIWSFVHSTYSISHMLCISTPLTPLTSVLKWEINKQCKQRMKPLCPFMYTHIRWHWVASLLSNSK